MFILRLILLNCLSIKIFDLVTAFENNRKYEIYVYDDHTKQCHLEATFYYHLNDTLSFIDLNFYKSESYIENNSANNTKEVVAVKNHHELVLILFKEIGKSKVHSLYRFDSKIVSMKVDWIYRHVYLITRNNNENKVKIYLVDFYNNNIIINITHINDIDPADKVSLISVPTKELFIYSIGNTIRQLKIYLYPSNDKNKKFFTGSNYVKYIESPCKFDIITPNHHQKQSNFEISIITNTKIINQCEYLNLSKTKYSCTNSSNGNSFINKVGLVRDHNMNLNITEKKCLRICSTPLSEKLIWTFLNKSNVSKHTNDVSCVNDLSFNSIIGHFSIFKNGTLRIFFYENEIFSCKLNLDLKYVVYESKINSLEEFYTSNSINDFKYDTEYLVYPSNLLDLRIPSNLNAKYLFSIYVKNPFDFPYSIGTYLIDFENSTNKNNEIVYYKIESPPFLYDSSKAINGWNSRIEFFVSDENDSCINRATQDRTIYGYILTDKDSNKTEIHNLKFKEIKSEKLFLKNDEIVCKIKFNIKNLRQDSVYLLRIMKTSGVLSSVSNTIELRTSKRKKSSENSIKMTVFLILISCISIAIIIVLYVLKCKYRNSNKLLDIKNLMNANQQYFPYLFEHDLNKYFSKEEILLLKTINCDCINLERKIGSGAFADVYIGKLKTNDNCSQTVAVKQIKSITIENQYMDFLREAMIMSLYSHKNLTKFYGICFLENCPKYLVLEYMDMGDLLSYLRNNRKINTNQMTYKRALEICIDIAEACEFLEQNKIVHRDIAARNCLMKEIEPEVCNQRNFLTKLGDFGFAREIYSNDYYRNDNKKPLPVRWMSPEALIDGISTTHSDVWSFGILVLETMTMGEQPYLGYCNIEVVEQIKNGVKPSVPSNCPVEIKNLMNNCWNVFPTNRPTFKCLVEELNNLYKTCDDETIQSLIGKNSRNTSNISNQPNYTLTATDIQSSFTSFDYIN